MMAVQFSMVDEEMMLRLRIYKLCGSSELMWKIIPAGVKSALDGEDKFVRAYGLSAEEHAARVRLIPGHVLEVYQGCYAAYMGQAA